MPEDAESYLGIKKTETANATGVPPAQAVPPGSMPASGHQLSNFPVALVILLHYMTCGIFSLVWLNLMHGKLPRVRFDDPSAGRAVGFCFIPFFNFYWIFFTYRRLCLRIDEQRELYGLPPSNLRGMATTNCIFQVIPYINGLIGYTIITPIFIGLLQSSVNQLANKSATTAPQGTLPTLQKPAPGMPSWAIALIVCGCLIPFIIAILAALLLPALASAKHRAQEINSVNNMKQIGLAIRIWEGDNADKYPWNVSQTNGGVQEVCGTDANGFEKNPVAVFMVMSNELSTPKILVCADDPNKQPAPDFASLTANNISYQLRTGTNVNESNPDEVLAVDPINGYVLHCDGSVQKDLRYKK
jgi:type II secretory pathway pseudopilin PulG